MKTSSGDIVVNAKKNKLAVPAFNIPYLPMVKPVIDAVKAEDAFAFITVARLEWIKFESGSLEDVYDEYALHADPACVRIHLDHVPVIDEDNRNVDYINILNKALDKGYQSVMVDGSRLSLQENIECTRAAVALAHERGVPCEAELGAVMGHEEEPEMSYEELFSSGQGFTDVDEAELFVKKTGCDWLSVAIGNVHGAIAAARKDEKKVEARLDLEHLSRLVQATDVPLVLHGGSSVIHDYLLQAIRAGMAKVNVATEIRQPYEQVLSETGSVEAAREAVYEKTAWLLREYIQIAGKRKLFLGEST